MVNATAHIAGAGSANAARSANYGIGFYGAGLYSGTLIYEDSVLTPAPTVVLASLASTAVSNSFTPPPNALVVVAVSIGFHSAQPSAPAVSVADSAGNAYLPNTEIYDGSTNGSYFFSFGYGPSTQPVTITVTRSVTAQAMIQIAPRVIIGAAGNQGNSGTLVVPSASAAVAVVQSTAFVLTASLTSATVTLPNPTTSGNSLVACILAAGNTTNPVVTGITLGGVADHWNPVTRLAGTSEANAEIWYDANCASGQTVITVTCGSGAGGQPGIWVAVYEITGVVTADQASANDDTTGTATTWTSGTTSTTSRPNEILFGVMRGRVPVVVTGVGTWTTQNLNEAYAGYQIVSSPGAVTFTGSQTAYPYVAAVASFAGPPTGSSPSTAISGSITTNRAGSLVYVTGTVGNTESATAFAPTGGTNQLAAASSATDTESAALGRLPGVGAAVGTFPVGWTVPTAAPFSLAALEIFGPLADTNTSIAGAGNATANWVLGSIVSPKANIGGAGNATSGLKAILAANITGGGVASGVVSGGLEFEFGTAQGAGEADQVVPIIGALAPAQGAGVAVAVATVGAPGAAQGAGEADQVQPTVGVLPVAAGAGVAAVISPPAAGLVLGSGVALAVPTLPAGAGTAAGAGAAVARPAVSVVSTLAGAGVVAERPLLKISTHLAGAGVAIITTGPEQPLAGIGGAGVAIALPRLTLTAALQGAARLAVPAPAGAVNTDDTIEPGPCTLFMAVGPTTSRAPFSAGGTSAYGTTVGGSTSGLAVGNTVNDRGR